VEVVVTPTFSTYTALAYSLKVLVNLAFCLMGRLKMNPVLQKSLALVGGIAIFIGSLLWALLSSSLIANMIGLKIGLASEFADGDAVYKKFSDIYTALSFLGVALAAGTSFTLLTWERRPRKIVSARQSPLDDGMPVAWKRY
jgi:hypothetical protein